MTPLEIAAIAFCERWRAGANGDLKGQGIARQFSESPKFRSEMVACMSIALMALCGTASVGCCLRTARRLGLPPSEVDMAFNGVIDAILGEKP